LYLLDIQIHDNLILVMR